MPYVAKGKTVYRADTGKKVGTTKGSVKKYLAALHANVKAENKGTGKTTMCKWCGRDVPDSMYPSNFCCDDHYRQWVHAPELKDGSGKRAWPHESIDYDVDINHKPLIVKENEVAYGLEYNVNDEYIPKVTPSEDGQIKNGRTDSTICEVKKLIKQLLKEELESSVVKNIKAVVADVEEFLKRPENIGTAFTQKELETVDSIEVKPDTKTQGQIKYSSTDELSGKNKELIITKKQGRYIGFFTLSSPVDVTAGESPEDIDINTEEKKTVVLIKVSKPFAHGQTEDISLLSNFATQLVGEFQIK